MKISTKFFSGFLVLLITLSIGCSSAPEKRPWIKNPEFDKKLSYLLPFNTALIGVDSLARSQDQYIILDARPEKEYQVSHIPNALPLGYPQFNTSILEKISKDTPIIVYCSVGYRSDLAGKKLKNRGFKRVYNLYGSIFEWVNQGYPVIDDEGDTTRHIHTYNKKWSKWVEADSAVKIWE